MIFLIDSRPVGSGARRARFTGRGIRRRPRRQARPVDRPPSPAARRVGRVPHRAREPRRMRRRVDVLQRMDAHPRVHLRRLDVRVAQHRLDVAHDEHRAIADAWLQRAIDGIRQMHVDKDVHREVARGIF